MIVKYTLNSCITDKKYSLYLELETPWYLTKDDLSSIFTQRFSGTEVFLNSFEYIPKIQNMSMTLSSVRSKEETWRLSVEKISPILVII